jgi:hypothetical protein
VNQQVDNDLSVGGHFDIEGDGRLAVQTLEVATFAEVADLETGEGNSSQNKHSNKLVRNRTQW